MAVRSSHKVQAPCHTAAFRACHVRSFLLVGGAAALVVFFLKFPEIAV
jgi:hypothetical protein